MKKTFLYIAGSLAVMFGLLGTVVPNMATAPDTEVTLTPADLDTVAAIVKAEIAKLIPAPPKVDPVVDPTTAIVDIDGPTEWTVGSMVHLRAKGTATKIYWDPDPEIADGNNHEIGSDGRCLAFTSPTPGKFVFFASGVDATGNYGGKRHTVVIGTPTPPTPVDPPKPPTPVPVAGQISVLIVEETNDRGSPAIKPFLPVLNSTIIRGYLNAHCAKDAGLPAWRFLDKDQLPGLPAKWAPAVAAYKAAAPTTPWILILDSKGTLADSKELPKSEADAIALLTKWGGS